MKNIVVIRTPEHVQLSYTTAGIGTRMLAKLIDHFIILVLSMFLLFFIPLIGVFIELLFSMGSSGAIAISIFIYGLFPFFYFTFTEFLMGGQTPGKKILGIRVIRDTGGNADFFTILLRNLMLIADLLPLFYLAGIISMFAHSKEKRLGDLVAGTLVVMEKKPPEPILSTVPLYPKEIKLLELLPPLPIDKLNALELFLSRREQLDEQVRKNIVQRLLTKWWPQIMTKPGTEESFLEKVYVFHQKRQRNEI